MAVEILKLARYGVKLVQMGQAAANVYECATNDRLPRNQRIIQGITNAGFVALQGATIAAPSAGASPNLRIALEAGVGVCDLAQRVALLTWKKNVQFGDWVDLGCLVLFRVSSVTRTTVTLQPELFEGCQEEVKDLSTFLDTFASIVQFRDVPGRVWVMGKKQLTTIFKYCQGNEEASLELSLDDDLVEEATKVKIILDDETAKLVAEFEDVENIYALDKIPELLREDDELKKFICPLTKQPIRHIVVVAGTQNSPCPVYYEKEDICSYLQRNERDNPPGWPQRVSCNRKNILPSPSAQAQINRRLEAILKDFKEMHLPNSVNEGRLSPTKDKIIRLLKEIQISGETPSKIVADKILNVVPKNVAFNVRAQRMKHKFKENVEKIALKITIQKNYGFIKGNDLSVKDQRMALFALIGSSDEAEQEALKKAMKAFKTLELYISQDFESLSAKFLN